MPDDTRQLLGLPLDADGLLMTPRIRLILLVLAIAYSATFGVGEGVAAGKNPTHAAHRVKKVRLRVSGGRRVRVVRRAATVGDRAVRFARRLLGTPYSYGGSSPGTGFDCSGFVRFVYAHFGLSLPHSSYADFTLGRRVGRGALEPGDLVFFDGVGHVGLYVGRGRFIHAPHTGTVVQVTSLDDPWYRATYDGARRLVARPVTRLVAHTVARGHRARRVSLLAQLTDSSFRRLTGRPAGAR